MTSLDPVQTDSSVPDIDEGYLVLDRLTKRYGGWTAVDHFDIAVSKGEFIAFLGPSGCGKTTTLRMIAGFIDVDEGGISIGGRRVEKLPSRQRETAMVFQDYALFPHMTVYQNVAFGLKMRKVPKGETERRVQEVLDVVHLGDVGKKYPRELSGGMRQRVALARAIVVEPQILLLDEPLSALDAKLRKQLRTSLKELHDRIGITTVFVTHDIEEAFYLADRVVVMNAGKIEQFDTPQNIYSKPRSHFVADLIGHTNFIEGELRTSPSGSVFVGGGLEIESDVATTTTQKGRYTIPPHLIRLTTSRPNGAAIAARGTVALSAYLGSSYSVLVNVGDVRLQSDVSERDVDPADIADGKTVWVSWQREEGHYVAT